MAEKKKQHYVAQSYLRNFSVKSDEKNIGVYVLKSGTHLASVPLRDQAYEKYFYGKDLQVENALSNLEGRVAKIMREVMDTSVIPSTQSKEFVDLLAFSVFQHERTRYAADALDEATDKMMKATFSDHPKLKDDIDKVKISHTDPARMAVAMAAKSLPVGLDLAYKLIVNESPIAFLTSDNPSVYYNQFLESRKPYGSNSGLAILGFQLFLPISPRHMLVFYDSTVYAVGARSSSVVHVDQGEDVKSLNLLQALSSHECLFFDHTFEKKALVDLVGRADHSRRAEKMRVEKFYALPEDQKRRSLLWLSRQDVRCGLQLSFIRVIKKAKKRKLDGRAIHVRNEGLVEAFQQSRGLDRQVPPDRDMPSIFLREKPPDWEARSS